MSLTEIGNVRIDSSMCIPVEFAHQDKALERHTAPRSEIRSLVELRLEADRSPGDNHPSPVACFGGRGEVSIAKGPDAVFGDPERFFGTLDQVLDLLLEVREIPLDLDKVGVRPT